MAGNTLGIKLTIALSWIFILSGCTDIRTRFSTVTEPLDGNRARLRIIANSLVKAIPGRDCVDFDAKGAGTAFGGTIGSRGVRYKSLGMPSPPDDPSLYGEMYVAAGLPFTLAFIAPPQSPYQCSFAMTFVPETGKDYEARMFFDLSAKKCTATLTLLGEEYRSVPFRSARACKNR